MIQQQYLTEKENKTVEQIVKEAQLKRVKEVNLSVCIENKTSLMLVTDNQNNRRPEKVFFLIPCREEKRDKQQPIPMLAMIGITLDSKYNENGASDYSYTESYEIFSINNIPKFGIEYLKLIVGQQNYQFDTKRKVCTFFEKYINSSSLFSLWIKKLHNSIYSTKNLLRENDNYLFRVNPILGEGEIVPPMIRAIGSIREIYIEDETLFRDDKPEGNKIIQFLKFKQRKVA